MHRISRTEIFQIAAFFIIWGLGTWGWLLSPLPGESGPWFEHLPDCLYHALQLFIIEYHPALVPGWEPSALLNVVRFVAPVVTILAVLEALGGSVLTRGRAFYYGWRDQIWVIGYGAAGRGLVRALRKTLPRAHIIAVDSKVSELDRREARQLGLELFEADASELSSLSALPFKIANAAKVYVALGDDAQSIATAAALAKLSFKKNLQIWMHVEDRALLDRLRHVFAAPGGKAQIKSFSLHEAMGEQMVAQYRPMLAARAMGHRRMHAVLVHFDDLLWSLTEVLTMAGSFPPPVQTRPRFTILDSDAVRTEARWKARHPDLWRWADFHFITADAKLVAWSAADKTLAGVEALDPPSLYIFGRQGGREGLSDALALRLGMERGERLGAPVFVATQIAGVEELNLRMINADLCDGMEFIGDAEDAACHSHAVNPYLDEIARALHEYYRKNYGGEPYDALPETLQVSNRRAALHAVQLLAAHGFEGVDMRKPAFGLSAQAVSRLEHLMLEGMAKELPQLTAIAGYEHLRWCVDRTLDGWRHGTRDDEAMYRDQLGYGPKLYAELEESERDKDREQMKALLEALRLQAQDAGRSTAIERVVELDAPAPTWQWKDGALQLVFDKMPNWQAEYIPADEALRYVVEIPPEPALRPGDPAPGAKAETPDVRAKMGRRPAYAKFAQELAASAPSTVRFRLKRRKREGWNWLGEVKTDRVDGVTLPPLSVGFVGHRDLAKYGDIGAVTAHLRNALAAELERLRGQGRAMRLVSGGAEGADRLLISLWRARNCGPILGLFPDADAAAHFPLKECLTAVEIVPAALAGVERHVDLARRILDSSDILIAVYDGGEGHGAGGTADMVQKANVMGKNVIAISPLP